MKGAKNSKGNCECVRDPDWKPPSGFCEANKIWSEKHWGCIELSDQCRGHQVWDRRLRRCRNARCGKVMRWDSGLRDCVCKPGYFTDFDGNKCVKIDCGEGFIWSVAKGSCVVNPRYSGSCPPTMVWSGDKQRCICTRGFVYSWSEKRCREVNCGEIRNWSKSKSRCVEPECPYEGQFWRRSRGGCKCDQGWYLNKDNRRCEEISCNVDEMWSDTKQSCVLNPEYCPVNNFYNRQKRKCECN